MPENQLVWYGISYDQDDKLKAIKCNLGFVTSTEITHATPGALYAHSYDRDYQCDADLDEELTPDGVHDIAWQLVNREPGKHVLYRS